MALAVSRPDAWSRRRVVHHVSMRDGRSSTIARPRLKRRRARRSTRAVERAAGYRAPEPAVGLGTGGPGAIARTSSTTCASATPVWIQRRIRRRRPRWPRMGHQGRQGSADGGRGVADSLGARLSPAGDLLRDRLEAGGTRGTTKASRRASVSTPITRARVNGPGSTIPSTARGRSAASLPSISC